MLDIKFIRENLDLVKEAVRKKRLTVNLDQLITLDDSRLVVLREVEALRAKQNEASDAIAKVNNDDKQTLISEMKKVKEALTLGEERLRETTREWQKLMLEVPNIPDMSVSEGDTEADNVELKVWGDKPNFDFQPRDHTVLLGQHHLVDFERGAKVAGFRGYFLTGGAVTLSFVLWQLARELLSKDGFEQMIVPSLVRPEAFLGTGYLPQGIDDLYQTQDGDFLAGTAEVATMGYFLDEVIPVTELPKKIAAFSPCFRREAGSHGKDTKGLIRVHEFYKVEQVILCEANHEESVRWHEALLETAEKLMQVLGLPYRVVVNCSGDLGLGQVKKYDIEAWVPAEGKYRETHSISYFHDFQTRRLNTKYKDVEGKLRFAHSLNGTLAATPRLLVSVIENYQTKDGRVKIPTALRPYFDGEYLV
ncbi:MAG: serine--tRNA ligase [Candidatus Vogelbacteria bacterium]|nr:serine--tRNA ligase [Candidatus Vogelbacteria bacterium]